MYGASLRCRRREKTPDSESDPPTYVIAGGATSEFVIVFGTVMLPPPGSVESGEIVKVSVAVLPALS